MPSGSGGVPPSPRRISSPFQLQLAANQIVGQHILTSTQFNKDQVIPDDIIIDHVISLLLSLSYVALQAIKRGTSYET